jgi:hypothetical protein
MELRRSADETLRLLKKGETSAAQKYLQDAVLEFDKPR